MKLHSQILIISLCSLFLSSFTPLWSIAEAAPEGEEAGGVGDICQLAENAQLCQETIVPNINEKATTPRTVLVKDIETLVQESNKAVKATKDAQAKDPDNAESYKVCSEMFRDSQDDLRAAKEALAANDMVTARTKISGALTYFGTCDDTFDESGIDNPLAETTARLKKLASNCLAIAAI